MFATVRRYTGVDVARSSELATKVNDKLLPAISKLPGFSEYYLIEAGDGVLESISVFDTSMHADESSRLATNWVKEEKLEGALPNAPKVTSGEIVAHDRSLLAAV